MKEITKCTTEECPIRNACLRFTSDPTSDCQYYAPYEFKIIHGNHVSCDFFITNREG